MKVIRIVFGLLLAALLSACGGGGGSPGSPGGVDIALFTSAPATGATVPLNGAEVYAVGGGKAPYTVSSSNRFVALAGVSGNKITVGGVAEGTASVEVRDALGAAVTFAVKVSDGDDRALYTTAPSALTLTPGSTTLPFEARGGVAPYVVASDNPSVITVSQSGSTFSLTALIAGTANVTVTDNTGVAPKTIVVSVKTNPGTALALNPAAATGNVGDTITVLVSGGTGNYVSATAANTTIATASLSGSSVSISLKAAGTTAVSVRDSAGQIVQIAVTATNTAATLRLSPETFSVSELNNSPFSVSIFGGTAPYRVFVDDQALASASVSGSTLTIGLGTQGSRCVAADTDVKISIIDNLGAAGAATMKVLNEASTQCGAAAVLTTTAGGDFTLVAGQSRSITVSGGVKFNPAPTYEVTSANPAVATVSALTGDTFSVTAVAAGTSTITVRDAANTVVTFVVTVP
jgi:hypothetical protein